MGVPWGAPDDLNTSYGDGQQCPEQLDSSAPLRWGATRWRMSPPLLLAGGNVRVGLEDNLWLEKGRLASNAELVERAVTIVEAMGVGIMTPAEVRAELNLTRQDPP